MNLIITCPRHFEDETKDEVYTILKELGDAEPILQTTEFSGIITAQTKIVPLEVIRKILEKLENEPWSVRYIQRVIPVFETVDTNIDEISGAVLRQTFKMNPNETYRITVEKRNSPISTTELINYIASKIKNKVSLKKYDWLVLVEILGKQSGVSILKECDILSVQKAKRGSLGN